MDDDLGKLGEALVERWLQPRAQLLARRWRCRWGELDLVARGQAGLHFVEVKTRSQKSWDAGGLQAIAPRKQACLYRSASLFLSQHPSLADVPCQFFLARVSGRWRGKAPGGSEPPSSRIVLGQPVLWGAWELTLRDYQPIELEIF